jgi:hypothetical protein
MRYSIRLQREWTPPPSLARCVYPKGVYKVPKEMPLEVAERAVKVGLAVKIGSQTRQNPYERLTKEKDEN